MKIRVFLRIDSRESILASRTDSRCESPGHLRFSTVFLASQAAWHRMEKPGGLTRKVFRHFGPFCLGGGGGEVKLNLADSNEMLMDIWGCLKWFQALHHDRSGVVLSHLPVGKKLNCAFLPCMTCLKMTRGIWADNLGEFRGIPRTLPGRQ